jgi:hypothetical protein
MIWISLRNESGGDITFEFGISIRCKWWQSWRLLLHLQFTWRWGWGCNEFYYMPKSLEQSCN